MPTCIEVGGREQVGEGIVVSMHNKWLVHEVFFEVISACPLQAEELGLTQVVVLLSFSQ